MSDNSPAFQYYPADLISDPKVMFWDMERVGCYWQMVTYLWLNGGKAELNSVDFCILFRVKRKLRAQKLWDNIKHKFDIQDGIITHKRVAKEMQKQQESRVRRQKAGRKGAEKRWQSQENANGKAIKKDMAKNGPSSSTSTSTSVNPYSPPKGNIAVQGDLYPGSSGDNSSAGGVNKRKVDGGTVRGGGNGIAGGGPAKKKTQKDRILERFEKFWQAYPKKVGKGSARKAFRKQQPTDRTLELWLEALEKQKGSKQWKADCGKFIPNPANWLDGERWNDELVEYPDGDDEPPTRKYERVF